MEPLFFATPSEFRAWLERHHEDVAEQWVGFHKKGSGRPSITWPESVDEALCFGWIDGQRRSIDGERYKIRFSPRKPRSTWSLVNIGRVEALAKQLRMRPAGVRAFEARREEASGTYSYEQRNAARLDPVDETRFRASKRAWAFFQSQAPSYRRAATWCVVSAKREETRRKRLATLIDDSAHGRPIKPLTRPAGIDLTRTWPFRPCLGVRPR